MTRRLRVVRTVRREAPGERMAAYWRCLAAADRAEATDRAAWLAWLAAAAGHMMPSPPRPCPVCWEAPW
jgi:hypothetical protein